MPTSSSFPIYLERAAKRVFAGALDWPGWLVSGRDEASAIQALLDSAPRYAAVLRGTRLGFKAPKAVSDFKVVERLKGNAATDFGAANIAPKADKQSVDAAELRRLEKLLQAAWRAFDRAAEAAQGKALSKGPRGGGRDLDGITRHVLGAEASYLSSLGWKLKYDETADFTMEIPRTRAIVLEGLAASVRGEVPKKGPRGGQRWSPRYFVRRAAWHVLDHAWEIEKRLTPAENE